MVIYHPITETLLLLYLIAVCGTVDRDLSKPPLVDYVGVQGTRVLPFRPSHIMAVYPHNTLRRSRDVVVKLEAFSNSGGRWEHWAGELSEITQVGGRVERQSDEMTWNN